MEKNLQKLCLTGLMAGMLIAGGCGGGNNGSDPKADLTVLKSHVGNFTQGQNDARYTITVKNIGDAVSSGVITVKEEAPAGLTIRSLTGTGWDCNLATTTCTRSDQLAATGGTTPAITVSVDVAADAAATLINKVTVSGGADANTTNNTASDSTIINISVDAIDVYTGGNEPYDASTGALTFKIHPAATFTYNINKFAAGDKLVFDHCDSMDVAQSATVDGMIDVVCGVFASGSVSTIHLTGIDPVSDGKVFGVNSFRTEFGAESLQF